ncbi:ABC transporter substrate-binding protein [Nonomuraea endophytica]|uniref:NitT/TauT family transport system substrate-binding protein n=1 Tax=Nonomuraea endophytica TaxID=714136 RepID=A0A7W8A5E9_9ACTN|nr:ABC transporter substrate-binding protein [Nonomuraea endophytica]MBB5079190.1 NitT/TauT family transport system substrate-binding protein [Nonomuraea endophytica]
MHLKRLAALAVMSALAACGVRGTETNPDGTLSFSIAVTEPDITTVPILAAVDVVRQAGHKVEVVELAEPELAIGGLAEGAYAFSAEATSPALSAIEQEAPIRIVADAIGNQWAIYGKSRVTCDDLNGRPFGIFSRGAVATAMTEEWVRTQCTGGRKPEYLTIGGSDVRAQALVAGEIDATALELADVVALERSGDSSFTQVVDFGETLPDLRPQTVYANTGFLAEHRDVAQLFVSALVREHAKINADPRHLVSLVKTYLPEEETDDVAEIAERSVEAGLFDAAGLTERNMQVTIDFFVRAGVIEPGMTAKDATDLSFIKAAA